MTIRPRSLVSNSLSSIVASGLLIFSTVLIPAILVRAISRPEYDLLSAILAALPLLSIVPQSFRSAAASQLALAYARHRQLLATRAYARFGLGVGVALAIASAIGTELYMRFGPARDAEPDLFRFGLYCVAGHCLGLIAVGLFTGPAAARRDFLPDNLAKLWPGLFQLAGVATIWVAEPARPVLWISLVYLASSWSVAAILALRLWSMLYEPSRAGSWRAPALGREFLTGLRGATWWNLTAYLATSAAVLIVAVRHPTDVVPFSVASSLLGITSAGLIAVASPISGYAVGLSDREAAERRRFFLLVNSMFQLYILIAAAVLVAAPERLFILWLEPGLAQEVRRLCLLLLPAYMLRLLTMAFTVFVMSAGRQHEVWLSPLLEGVAAVVGSVVLGEVMGIAGVALALTLAAAFRLAMTCFYDEGRNARALDIRRGDLLLSGPRWLRTRR